MRTVAAVDLGAESGRVVRAGFDGTRFDIDVAHRFAHSPRTENGILRWDMDTLLREVTAGLTRLDAGGGTVDSVGVDAWGVDYGLFRVDGRMVDQPTCYRDPRQLDAMKRAVDAVGADAIYDATGVQLMPINTIFGLTSDLHDHPDRLAAAERLQMMPDVFHRLLSGSTGTEYTAASTTGALDMRTGRWATGLLAALGIPDHLLPEVIQPGTDVGALRGGFTRALSETRVIVPPAHDTASAVVAVPFTEPGALFISSGTWSLVGVETSRARVDASAKAVNLTNEGGYGGTIRLLRNVMGLWLLQECRKQWHREGADLGYAEIAELARAEPGLVSVVNPDSTDFLLPGDMPRRIQEYCARTGQPVPATVGAIARCAIDSLALGYRRVLDAITAVTGTRPPAVNIVGGGARHTLLSQLTSDATGLPVRCGPVEATAMGNAAVQLAALGEFGGVTEIRAAVADSADLTEYEPRARHDWTAAAALLDTLTNADGLYHRA
ncbi:rhamnulokinase [Amycolatopsis sp. CA-230715]|uniref:rhamnulokinase n=1 Tax=Amycolatopsis sp. CA-230715 TaxID=2745196 RepID=UPI001C036BC0|nr:rhamnulokinase family protein [Amycolatopsis sp. CA-230715]QWF83628.1 Rhamnulokinase [Amycolatopsis sp. CA-230715]